MVGGRGCLSIQLKVGPSTGEVVGNSRGEPNKAVASRSGLGAPDQAAARHVAIDTKQGLQLRLRHLLWDVSDVDVAMR